MEPQSLLALQFFEITILRPDVFDELLSNILRVCWDCNVAFESVPVQDLLERYPSSSLRPMWEDTLKV